MRTLVGLVIGILFLTGGGWLRWCPSPPFGETYADPAGVKMLSEMGIVLLALGTFLVGAALNRWFSPREW